MCLVEQPLKVCGRETYLLRNLDDVDSGKFRGGKGRQDEPAASGAEYDTLPFLAQLELRAVWQRSTDIQEFSALNCYVFQIAIHAFHGCDELDFEIRTCQRETSV